MIISILTLFPEVFKEIFSSSIIGRAQKKGLVNIRLVNIRDFAFDKHKSVDDKPYGGGVGMLLRVDVVECAITKSKINPFDKLRVDAERSRSIKNKKSPPKACSRSASAYGGDQPLAEKFKIKEKIILLDPKGPLFTQAKARRYAKLDHLILICGHYEGIDSRIYNFIDESISIGRYILTGGEIPAMVITDAAVRLIPKVLSKEEATKEESFSLGQRLEASQYTRPPVYKGLKVPEILLSGNHPKIAAWKKEQAARCHKESFK